MTGVYHLIYWMVDQPCQLSLVHQQPLLVSRLEFGGKEEERREITSLITIYTVTAEEKEREITYIVHLTVFNHKKYLKSLIILYISFIVKISRSEVVYVVILYFLKVREDITFELKVLIPRFMYISSVDFY